MSDELPEGFTLDKPPPSSELPQGFTLDQPQAATPRNDIEAANQEFLANNQGFELGKREVASNRAQRVGLGMLEPAVGLGQLAAHATGYGTESTDAAAQWIAQKEAEKKAEAGLSPEDWDYWSGAGNIASPVNFLPGAGIERAIGAGRTIAGMAGRGALAGTAYGAMQPVTDVTPENDYAAQKQAQMEAGLVTGGLTGAGAGVLAKVISPAASKTPAQLAAEGADDATIQHARDLELMNREGVRMTTGQTTGFQRGEGLVGDVPFAGGQYRDRVQAFKEDANRAALNRALRPFGGTELGPNDPVGTRGIQNLYNQFNNAYDQVHAGMMFTPFSPTFQSQMAADFRRAINGSRLVDAQKDELRQLIQEQIVDKLGANNYLLPGKEIQGINSILRQESAGYAKSPDWDKRKLSYAIDKIQKAFSDELQRQNPNLGGRLNAIDHGYAHFVRLRKAAVAAKANDGIFTGNQLLNASTQMNNTVGKGQIARGADPYYQDLATAMTNLTRSMPNSGTPERIARLSLGSALTGAAGWSVPYHTVGTIGGLSAAYSEPGQKIINAAITKRPNVATPIARGIREYTPTVGTRTIMRANQEELSHEQRLNEIESGPHSPEEKRNLRRAVIEDAIRNP